MNAAEGLARQIGRVARLRGRYVGQIDGADLTLIDAALEQACKAAGSGDFVAIIAAGQQMEGIEA